ncbi:cupredoxin domain-containing protein [Pseudomarimonas arenosa]|uniref:Plastocyanin n=1 Tax=Pseudomarimonas arenosa TaxID=2774145 RepID=A0AAW3ZUA7_9GAMM|nr:hypothetical protein [Pseudomarimonas arenosa]MBD8527676.1 hypothetical protein [Pseudomarimonas arenosa]
MNPCRRLLTALLLALVGLPTGAAELRGNVRIEAMGQALRPGEASQAVVYFRPAAAFEAPQPMPMAQMVTRRKEFVPRVLPITPGTKVRFPNQDPILHNAFSSSSGNTFDTGVYGSGDGAEHVFTKPGLVNVYCNVHHSMAAYILVLDTPWFTQPDAQGNFVLRDVPEGPGDLVVYHDRSAPWTARIDPSDAPEQVVVLELTRRKVPPHMNKFGKPYGRAGNTRNY